MIEPMLASLGDAPLDDPHLVYEPKYDGIRAIAEVGSRVRLWSRLGNEKTHQFPEVTAALAEWGRRLEASVVLDGEIVALNENGEPTGFQQLQGRIHVSEGGWTGRDKGVGSPFPHRIRKGLPTPLSRPPSVAFIAFDILRDGGTDLRERPLLERRAMLERLLGGRRRRRSRSLLRLSDQVRGDGRALYRQAFEQGWEGLIAKRADSPYKSGKRTPDWRKIKIVHEQEFVVGGWTEPRHTRSYFGALLLGVYENGQLVNVGHTGTGFNQRELDRVMKSLKALETQECPFRERPKTNERPHWVRPELVAQIKFTEWTNDGKLRHPVYLGLRDDKKPQAVHREDTSRLHVVSKARLNAGNPGRRGASATPPKGSPTDVHADTAGLVDQLRAIEGTRRDGTLTLPGGDRLDVTNLHKVFWPKQKLTKGDLFRYYVRVAPFVLPAVADRPLVMKRYPNGIAGKWFYQHRVEDVAPGVRSEVVSVVEQRPQIIGGTLKTVLYTTQLAAISQDPWFSRVPSPEFADYAALDLDPSAGAPFARVLDVARWIRDELDELGATGIPKTSGASGLHVYVPMPPRTPYDAGLLFCQIIATVVAQKHPKVATVERSVRARGERVYVDCLQNVLGKTLASAYSARASEYAGVSTPLTWREIDDRVNPEHFTIETVPERLKKVGDLWAALRTAKGVDLSRVARYAERTGAQGSKRA
jgi:bifunctional non-homologous end joining protein LigD